MKTRIAILCVATLVVVLTMPASAGIIGVTGSGSGSGANSTAPGYTTTTLFSDLGPSGNVYECCSGWTVSGSGTLGTSFSAANEFNSGLGGKVLQVDLGVGYVAGSPQFYASIWTDVAGLPGTQVAGAYWDNLASTETIGSCCNLVTIAGISGVFLNPGTNYFMMLGPEDPNDTSWNGWNWNSLGMTGLDLYSKDGGLTWLSNGIQPLGSFDLIGDPAVVPEPSSFLLLGMGLLGVLGAVRRQMNR